MRRISLTQWIFIAMFAGVALGHFFPQAGQDIEFLGRVFLRLIKSIIAPLLFAALVYGIAGSGSAKAMGRIGLKSLIYFNFATGFALVIGLVIVNIFEPGAGVSIAGAQRPDVPVAATGVAAVLEHAVPTSIVDAMARNEVLQLVVFSVLFGLSCIAIGEKAAPVVNFCRALSEVMFAYTKYVMYLAPLGVGGAIAAVVGSKGIGVLVGLGKLIGALYVALAIFVVVILGAVMVALRVPFGRFYRAVKDPFLLAFSTASSEAAFPMAMQNMERFGVPRHIVSFVLPTGYSFNLDGSTLYLAMASMFVVQAAGIEMTVSQQVTMMITLLLTSKGVAGVPRAALIVLAGTLGTLNLPLEGVAVLLGVDTLMDMGRTSVNLLGNCLATVVVARWERHPVEPAEDGPPADAALEEPAG